MATARRATKVDSASLNIMMTALAGGALPGETDGFAEADQHAAAALALAALDARTPDGPGLALETGRDTQGRRVMRLAIANTDMPFLVDSVAACLATHGINVLRLLHPVLRSAVSEPISLIYLELERVGAAKRRALLAEVGTVLAHVRAAVADWPAMVSAMTRDATTLAGEHGAFLTWLLDRHFTLLASVRYAEGGGAYDRLGLARFFADDLLGVESRGEALRWLSEHGPLLILKSSINATVHRRTPLDLLIVRHGDDIVVHAGLWTSAALATPTGSIPMLRDRLSALRGALGFAPEGHAGKALGHAFNTLPHDVMLAIDVIATEALALTSMSLADRPRPALVLASDALQRHVFAFVWVPRDDLSTARRVAIGELLRTAVEGHLRSWSIDLGESGVALLRYMIDRRGSTTVADAHALEREIEAMVRGWQHAVEVSLIALDRRPRAARLAIRYAESFPPSYRLNAGPDEAARDIVRLQALRGSDARDARLYRNAEDGLGRLRLKLYSLTPVTLSDAVPALENFGFRVFEEVTTTLTAALGYVHRFVLDISAVHAGDVLVRADVVEAMIAETIAGNREDDRFNELLIASNIGPRDILLIRALFRYLRQTGMAYGLSTFVDALARHADVAQALVAMFAARHDPDLPDDAVRSDADAIDAMLATVVQIDDDTIIRMSRGVILATLRTNFFVASGADALVFKLDSAAIPGLPAPVPWREIWVYAPRVEGIHLRAGPIARGGLRWSDRRDDFRTEILGLMKAQRVKNAVIVPTGAKGGFYPKALPAQSIDRQAWLAEGMQCYRIFIRALLSVTDNIIDGVVTHPAGIICLDDDDPYFVVAADKGTATFSDTANAIAVERGFWLGDAFASGGSVGYDHKAMGITAKGAWVSLTRHCAEAGIDLQADPVRVIGCGDMSGDVFGNGMLLSRSIRLIAAFDHRHIFIDPNPDGATSWEERARLFALPGSSWADYDVSRLSAGGGVHARSEKMIPLSDEARHALGIVPHELDPTRLISAILKSPVDLIWFGGIGTYVKARSEANSAVSDTANDMVRVNAEDLRARVVGEGANLSVTQAGRIAFSLGGGRINTDFIDNSAGVDCSDHEVNIKIALDAEVRRGTLSATQRIDLLASMTEAVGHLVLKDNSLQTLALSIAERGGAPAVPSAIKLIELFESTNDLDRAVEGLPSNEILARRSRDGQGLTRPELAVLLATAKLVLQDAITTSDLALDVALTPLLHGAFPAKLIDRYPGAVASHALRGPIVATQLANIMINRLGLFHAFELADEESVPLDQIAAAFVIVESLFSLDALWAAIDETPIAESVRLMMFEHVAQEVRAQMADILRNAVPGQSVGDASSALAPGLAVLDASIGEILREEMLVQTRAFADRLVADGAPKALADRIVRLAELDGAIGIAALSARTAAEPLDLARAFAAIGAELGIDWAQGMAMQLAPADPWERLLVAGLARDFGAMRIAFLERYAQDTEAHVARWLSSEAHRVSAINALIGRARQVAVPSVAMLAQIASQARVLLER